MCQPRAALRAVVVRARRADLEREVVVPVHALWTVRHIEAIANAETCMLGVLLVRELIGANIQASPALRVADEASYCHRALQHTRQCFALFDVFPVARSCAADLLVVVETIDL